MTGADVLCRCLEQAGGRVIFGVPGTQSLSLFEALRRSSIRTVLASQELSASFMANGFARVSGQPGLLTTIPGPGFTCSLTGLVEARHDSTPLIMLVPKPKRRSDRRFNLQAIDHARMASEVLKRSIHAERPTDIPAAVWNAFDTAMGGEPGPVLLEVATEALSEETRFLPDFPSASSFPGGGGRSATRKLQEAMGRIARAQRPLLLLGQGALEATDLVLPLVEITSALVVTSSSARGVLPEDHPHSICGDFSGWGVGLINELIEASDVILALGYKFSHNGSSGFALRIPRRKLIHVDVSPEVLNGNYPAAQALRMDARQFVTELLQYLGDGAQTGDRWPPEDMKDWRTRLQSRRLASICAFPELVGRGSPEITEIIGQMRRSLPRDAIVVTDVGRHQMVVRRLFQVQSPRGLILPSDFQSMGFGLPAGIGAFLAAPNRRTVVVTGDGGMAFVGLELANAVRENLNLSVLVFNDGHLGLTRLQQASSSGHCFGTRLGEIDFAALAKATGVPAVTITDGNLECLDSLFSAPGVKVVIIPLRESLQFQAKRVASLARSTGRSFLGEGLSRQAKRLWRFFLSPYSKRRR